jgi:CheY-like chemotaxis protein
LRHFKYRVLFVDDEKNVRETTAAILASVGYEVLTAEDGLEALQRLDGPLPELVITDLRMPNMSGFELLAIIRHRFPQIPTIAVSGEYITDLPDGMLADSFLLKGQYAVPDFLTLIADLLARPPVRPFPGTRNISPVWVPLRGSGEVIVTCPKCLRSSDIDAAHLKVGANQTACSFCKTCFTCNLDRHSMEAVVRNRVAPPLRKARTSA